jgi:hypothetical protein
MSQTFLELIKGRNSGGASKKRKTDANKLLKSKFNLEKT